MIHLRLRHFATLILSLLVLITPSVTATTWSEPMFGISLDLPDNAHYVEQTDDGALIKVVGEGSAAASLHLEQQDQDTILPAITNRALGQIGFGASQPTILEESPLRTTIAGHRAHWWTVRVSSEKRGEFYLAQAFIMLTPRRVAVIQSEADWPDADRGRELFDQLVNSFAVRDQQELAQEHRQRLERGRQWIDAVVPAMNQTITTPTTSWFLIELQGEAIGYERHVIKPATELGIEGISVEHRRRVDHKSTIQDSVIRAFASADTTVEVWESRSSIKQIDNTAAPYYSKAITAVRTGETLVITIEDPDRTAQTQHAIPPIAYLPMAHQLAMTTGWQDLLSDPVAYYSYYLPVESMTFALAEAHQASNGYQVMLYPAPRRAAQNLHFDNAGQLLEHTTPDGRSLRHVQASEIEAAFAGNRRMEGAGAR
ncbi:MAG: hypothetical protein RIG82_01110 [Phycisphaeraceae bacterium]